jgi:hypothetical protein
LKQKKKKKKKKKKNENRSLVQKDSNEINFKEMNPSIESKLSSKTNQMIENEF